MGLERHDLRTDSLRKNYYETFERLCDGGRVVHQCEPHVIAARIGPVAPGLRQKGTGYHFDTAAFP